MKVQRIPARRDRTVDWDYSTLFVVIRDSGLAWEAFWEWQYENRKALAAMSAAERFGATVDKLNELGLPEAIPWARVSPAQSPTP